jgi:hypothetical protein
VADLVHLRRAAYLKGALSFSIDRLGWDCAQQGGAFFPFHLIEKILHIRLKIKIG